MAHVTGPTTTLPEHGAYMPPSQMCDLHPDRSATHRICIEADSMGAEYADMCDECLTRYREECKKSFGTCELCRTRVERLHVIRYWDEGRTGPVHQVCPECREKERRALDREKRRKALVREHQRDREEYYGTSFL